MVIVLLSALVKRFSVSRLWDFCVIKNIDGYQDVVLSCFSLSYCIQYKQYQYLQKGVIIYKTKH